MLELYTVSYSWGLKEGNHKSKWVSTALARCVLSWQGQVPLYSLPCISYKERGLRLGEVHGSHHKAVTSCLPVPSRWSAAHQPCAPHRRDEHFGFGAVSSLTLLC